MSARTAGNFIVIATGRMRTNRRPILSDTYSHNDDTVLKSLPAPFAKGGNDSPPFGKGGVKKMP